DPRPRAARHLELDVAISDAVPLGDARRAGGEVAAPCPAWPARRDAASGPGARCRADRVGAAAILQAQGERRLRVALLAGCLQQALAPEINAATIRLLTRHGCDVAIVDGAGCCGSLSHHLGHEALDFARANIDAWMRAVNGAGLDAIVVNASGCGTTVKDYGFML